MDDYLDRLGSLALGSRLKRMSERLGQEVAQIYTKAGIDFEPKWFPVFRLLAEHQVASVTDVASLVGITHPAVNQVAQELSKAGLITSASDKADGRKRLLSLSPKGMRLAAQLEPVWQAVHCAISDLFEEADMSLLNAVATAESAMDRKGLLARYDEMSSVLKSSKPEVIEFLPEYSSHFVRLNRAWIEKIFRVEESDLKLFSNPQLIVDNGGFIFFVRIGSKIVGTCALIKVDDSTFELAKMAVDEAYRGMSLGNLLLEASVARAEKVGAKSVILETNRKLKAAVKLYNKFGFKLVETAHSTYERVDLTMKLDLTQRTLVKPSQSPITQA
ncbi:MAG: bifunctional helix-turn-helix transcriptional regulator/GNAT family N-acetyltransferase [Candidatus Obscuribacterales bacterium]|nr:bifunctional helix-turn-helix transcriptional regulator/GNAT family N-acetyltransferase [Candidatus Obscuribacterales bacterium]